MFSVFNVLSAFSVSFYCLFPTLLSTSFCFAVFSVSTVIFVFNYCLSSCQEKLDNKCHLILSYNQIDQ